MALSDRDRDILVDCAQSARKNAYAPYSHYSVGAAALDENGKVHTGCNIENASYGATMCAERVAVFNLVGSGAKQVTALALATQDGSPPCGMCLQVLSEFAKDPSQMIILCVNADAKVARYTLQALFPSPFKLPG